MRLLIYNRTDDGAVAPKAVIGGPKSHWTGGSFIVYPPKGWIVSTSRWSGRSGGGEELANEDGFVGVWSIHDNGDVPPRWILGGPNGVFQQTRNLVLDPKHRSLMIADKRLNAVLTFFFPEMF